MKSKTYQTKVGRLNNLKLNFTILGIILFFNSLSQTINFEFVKNSVGMADVVLAERLMDKGFTNVTKSYFVDDIDNPEIIISMGRPMNVLLPVPNYIDYCWIDSRKAEFDKVSAAAKKECKKNKTFYSPFFEMYVTEYKLSKRTIFSDELFVYIWHLKIGIWNNHRITISGNDIKESYFFVE